MTETAQDDDTPTVSDEFNALNDWCPTTYQQLVKAGHHPDDSAVLEALDELQRLLEEEVCPACLAPSNDGEGWDGYCGNCADRRDHLYENGDGD